MLNSQNLVIATNFKKPQILKLRKSEKKAKKEKLKAPSKIIKTYTSAKGITYSSFDDYLNIEIKKRDEIIYSFFESLNKDFSINDIYIALRNLKETW